jgi:phosphatidylcholine synthase
MEEISTARYWFYTVRAWGVHLYTSLGIVASFLALLSAVQGNLKQVVIILSIACFIDGTDGTLARSFKVKKWASGFDGRKLDDIVDYINYTFIPIFICYRFGLVTEVWLPLLCFVMIASIYGFCQNAAKTEDGFFTGFPNYWNFLVVYFFLFKLPPTVNALILFVFASLIWVPIKYISLSTKPLRLITISMSVIYTVIMIPVLINFTNPNMTLVLLSLIGPVYYFVISIFLTVKEFRLSQKLKRVLNT